MSNKPTIKELEKQIKELEKKAQFFQTIADNTYDWELFRDATGKILYCNKAFERITGYTVDEYLNGQITEKDFIHPEDWEFVSNQMKKMLNDLKPEFDIEFKIVTKLTVVKTLNLCSLPVFQNKKLIGFRISIRDISDSKFIEQIQNAKEKEFQNIEELQFQKAEIQFQNERLESLLRISQFPTNSIQELLDFALNEAVNLTKSKIGYIYFYNDENKQFILNTWSKDVMKECTVLNPQTVYDLDKTGCWGEAVRQRKPIILNDYQAENPIKKGTPHGHVKLYRFLTIPVIIDDKIVAVAGVANKKDEYDNADIRQLTLLMDRVWKISERLLLISELNKAKNRAEESEKKLLQINEEYEALNEELKQINEELKQTNDYLLNAREKAEQNEQKYKIEFLKANQFADILDNLPSYVYIKNLEHKYTFANKITLKLFNKTNESIIGCTDNEFFPPDTVDQIWNIDNKVFEKKQATKEEVIVKNNDKIITSYLEMKYPLYDENGKVCGLCGISTDITELKNAEQTIRDSEKKFKNLFQFMDEGIVRSDNSGIITLANDAIAKMFEYNSPFEMIGLPITELYSKEQRAQMAQDLKKTGVLRNYEIQTKTKTGIDIWVLCNIKEITDENGEIKGREGIIRDISQLKKIEQALKKSEAELKELNATKDKFFSIISHDLKNSFNGILGFSELIIQSIDNPKIETVFEYVKIIHDSAKKTFELLENLLYWAKNQQENLPVRPEILNLYLLTNECILLVYDAAKLKNIKIFIDMPMNISIKADIEMLKTIFRNLLSNAVKYTKQGGKIEIKSKMLNNEVEISISDNGIGMNDETKNSLFQIGQTQSVYGTNGEKGTGFGLLLCKEFVEKHGGKIWVESETDKGSDFKFTIPLF